MPKNEEKISSPLATDALKSFQAQGMTSVDLKSVITRKSKLATNATISKVLSEQQTDVEVAEEM